MSAESCTCPLTVATEFEIPFFNYTGNFSGGGSSEFPAYNLTETICLVPKCTGSWTQPFSCSWSNCYSYSLVIFPSVPYTISAKSSINFQGYEQIIFNLTWPVNEEPPTTFTTVLQFTILNFFSTIVVSGIPFYFNFPNLNVKLAASVNNQTGATQFYAVVPIAETELTFDGAVLTTSFDLEFCSDPKPPLTFVNWVVTSELVFENIIIGSEVLSFPCFYA